MSVSTLQYFLAYTNPEPVDNLVIITTVYEEAQVKLTIA